MKATGIKLKIQCVELVLCMKVILSTLEDTRVNGLIIHEALI
jgi:hypothetical protein